MIQKPNSRPITMLPVFIEMVDGMLQTSIEQLGCLHLVYEQQLSLDHAVIARLLNQYTKQLKDHWLLEGQLGYWHNDDLRPSEKRAVARLLAQATELKDNSYAILKITRVIEQAMLRNAMDMDEFAWLQAWGTGSVRSRSSL